MPFFRALYSWQPLLLLFIIPTQTMGIRHGEAVIGVLFIPGFIQAAGKALAWMGSTPVSPRRMFAWMMGIPLAVYVASFLIISFSGENRFGSMPVDGRFLAASFLGSLLLLVTVTGCSLKQTGARWNLIPKTTRYTAYAVQLLLLIGIIMPWFRFPDTRVGVSLTARAAWLAAGYLPSQPVVLIGLSLTTVVVSYFLMETWFVRSEPMREFRRADAGL
jgi:hypothetical protein